MKQEAINTTASNRRQEKIREVTRTLAGSNKTKQLHVWDGETRAKTDKTNVTRQRITPQRCENHTSSENKVRQNKRSSMKEKIDWIV